MGKGVAQMGWETRSGRRYYYQKVRDGDRVVSKYVGTGIVADIAANVDHISTMHQRLERLQFADLVMPEEDLDRHLDEYEQAIAAVVRAFLFASGYHQHKRQWRLRRG